ncbi:MAG: hypothetical protein RLZ98_1387 [Pseudomonadota bacterium]|jgi:protein-disulfide isomerase
MSTTPASSFAAALTSGKGLALIAFAVLGTIALLIIGRTGSESQAGKPPLTAAVTTPTTASFSADQENAIGEIVKAYLIKNPQVLVDAGQALEKLQREQQEAQAQKVLSEKKNEIFRSPLDFVYGNPKGDITVVEYFDYNCGWCKRALDEVVKIVEADPNVRVVMKEFPVFGGPPSVEAAKAALASMKQGKYWDFHTALMRERRVTPENLYQVAARIGLDVEKLKKDMAAPEIENTLRDNVQYGRMAGIDATPGFLLDTRVNVGYLAHDEMKAMLADIRKQGCKVC